MTQTQTAVQETRQEGAGVKPFIPYVCFDGTCREAMEFYKKTLDCDLHAFNFADAPVQCTDNPEQAAAVADRVMHARLTLGGQVLMMASDSMPGMPYTQGNSYFVNVLCGSAEQVDRVFGAFSEGGKVIMPVQETFWAERFGMVTDRFGINWMLLHGEKAT